MIKRFCMVISGIVCVMMLLSGCNREKSGKPGAVEVLTGKTQLEVYKKTKSKIKEIDRSRREQNQAIE